MNTERHDTNILEVRVFVSSYSTPPLLVGIVIEGEAEEVEVDTSLRGRLNSLVEKVKTLRKKKEDEEEPEVKEETKPSKIKLTRSHFI